MPAVAIVATTGPVTHCGPQAIQPLPPAIELAKNAAKANPQARLHAFGVQNKLTKKKLLFNPFFAADPDSLRGGSPKGYQGQNLP